MLTSPFSAPLSSSQSLGLQKGEPLLAELKSYLLLNYCLATFSIKVMDWDKFREKIMHKVVQHQT